MTNPLVADESSAEPPPWAGVWIAEDIEQIIHGVQSGSWIDGGLGLAAAGLDGLALVSDPVGGLLQYGIAWLIEHVELLSEPLDRLAGNPGQIADHAHTWRNVAAELAEQAALLERSVRWDLPEWTGDAATAYRGHTAHEASRLRALSRAADGLALMTEGAGILIGTVRLMVRDAVATVVSRLIVYATELVGSLGTLTPLVVEQVTTLCASWAARIAGWLRSLFSSIRHLHDAMRTLGDRITALRSTAGPDPFNPDPARTPNRGPAAADNPDLAGAPQAPEPAPDPPPPSGDPPRQPDPTGTGPPWPARTDLPGPARGADLKPPHQRHTVSGARRGQIRPDNTVILRGSESAVRNDIRRIAAGDAVWDGTAGQYVINGRSYGFKQPDVLYPISGPGLAKLDRNEYAALKLLVAADGDPERVADFTRNPRFLSHPEAVAKAKAVYDGTYTE